jgi:predicted transcriptional regulator YheO
MSSKVITESLYNSLERSSKEIGQYFVIAHRANIIKLSYKHGVSKVADMFSISRSTIYFWANSFKREGLEGLKNKSYQLSNLTIHNIYLNL